MMTISGRRKCRSFLGLIASILKDSDEEKMVVIHWQGDLLLIQVLAGAKKCGASSGDPKSPLPTPSPRFCGR
jgi:hypothetical protein